MKEFELAGVIEAMSGGHHRFKWELRQNPAGTFGLRPTIWNSNRNIQLDQVITMPTLSCQMQTRASWRAATRLEERR